ncbi:leucine-rich repeat-containing protein 43 [Rhinophrynus dorsalis]
MRECLSGIQRKSRLESGQTRSLDTYWESNDPEEESVETLNELLTCAYSPWGLEDSWSSEAQQLRKLAVQCPELITDQLMYFYFKSLRVLDKEVSDVDEHLLRFHNLEELVLSANKITTIISSNLPRTLKVLELGSNHISDLKDLAVNPPPKLQHLGLAYNRICCSSESKYLTSEFWPNLVSLDLSFNDLTDIFDLISKLSTLQQLRILVLQGNPLTFIPAYRGYTVDSLPLLSALDDIPILPDEKHQFSGLSKKQEALTDSAQVFVSIGKLQGIPNPINTLEQHTTGEYPLVTYNYSVAYEFIEDQASSKVEDAQTTLSSQLKRNCTELPGSMSSVLPQIPYHTGSYKTSGRPWLDIIDLEYKKKHTVRDLLALKSFLLSGMTVTVTEEKTLSWPLDPEQTAIPKSDKKGGGKEKDKGRPNSKGSKAGSKNKKKKDNLDELRHDPPIMKTLGSVHVTLESLVSGEKQMSTLCSFGVLYNNTEKQPSVCDKDSKKSKDRTRSGRESVDTTKTPRSSSGKIKRNHTVEVKPTEEQQLPQEIPLATEIQVQIIHWGSAVESHGGNKGLFPKAV